MGYLYEDDEELNNEESEKIGDVIREIKKEKRGSKELEENMEKLLLNDNDNKKTNVDNNYSVDNLLQSEEEYEAYLEDLLTKKDAKLFEVYIGANYDKISNNTFNFAAFILGGCYFIYRKSYLIGIILLGLTIGSAYFLPIALVPWYTILIFEFIISVFSGFLANQVILNDAASKILNLKVKKEKDLTARLKRIGGVNILAFFVIFIVSVGVSILLFTKPIIELISSFNII